MADTDQPIDPGEIGERDAPPVTEKPYELISKTNECIGAGKCAEVSDPDENVRAAAVCPAKKDRGVIHVIDRETGTKIAPDPRGDGTVSVD
jgi:hypothetical protein